MNSAAIIAVCFGLLLCFLGHRLARAVLALWAALVGYLLGLLAYASLIQSGAQIGSTPGWVIGAIMAALFAGLAYLFYAAAVLLVLGSFGWTLGAVIAANLGLAAGVQVAVAAVVAILLAAGGVVFDLPRKLMIFGTALLGASVITAGVRTIVESFDWLNLGSWSVSGALAGPWLALAAVLAVAGVVVQLRQQGEKSLRAAYSG
jgi:hypothetical protein